MNIEECAEFMDKFLETGEPEYLKQFLSKFRCNAGRGCVSCPFNAVKNNYHNQIGMDENTNQYGGACAIVFCLNESWVGYDRPRGFLFIFHELVINRESKICCNWGGYNQFPLETQFAEMLNGEFDHAKFIFSFLPVWETIKDGLLVDIQQ